MMQVKTLFILMGDKKEDDEFVLQIAFSFHKFMMYDETRHALLNNTQVGRAARTSLACFVRPMLGGQGPSA